MLSRTIESVEASKKNLAKEKQIRDSRIRNDAYAAARRLEEAARAERDRIRLSEADYEARQRLRREIERFSRDISDLEKRGVTKS